MSRMLFVAVVALFMMAPPTIAANANLKYPLECGAAKSTLPEDHATMHAGSETACAKIAGKTTARRAK